MNKTKLFYEFLAQLHAHAAAPAFRQSNTHVSISGMRCRNSDSVLRSKRSAGATIYTRTLDAGQPLCVTGF
jgi:hypothetical protein